MPDSVNVHDDKVKFPACPTAMVSDATDNDAESAGVADPVPSITKLSFALNAPSDQLAPVFIFVLELLIQVFVAIIHRP